MKSLVFLIIVFVSANTFFAKAQGKDIMQTTTDADIYWDSMPKMEEFMPKMDVSASIEKDNQIEIAFLTEAEIHSQRLRWANNLRYEEIYALAVRNWGIGFWNKFPKDPRVFIWLKTTTGRQAPRYWTDIQSGSIAQAFKGRNDQIFIDSTAINKWEKLYKEITSLTPLTRNQQRVLAWNEFKNLANKMYGYNESRKFDLEGWTKNLISFIKEFYTPDLIDAEAISQNMSSLISNATLFFEKPRNFGLNNEDLAKFIGVLENSGYSSLQKFASQKKSLMALISEPFQLNTKTIEGKKFNLKDYEGKLVLLDFWSIACSSCIQKMPEIKKVWDKYRNQGFEVVSVATIGYSPVYDKTGKLVIDKNGKTIYKLQNQMPKIKAIHEKVGAAWTLLAIDSRPGKIGKQIFEKYNFQWVPQLLLLDENGLLIEYNGEMMGVGELDSIIKKHLRNKVANNKKIN